jgi:hypothetical protein
MPRKYSLQVDSDLEKELLYSSDDDDSMLDLRLLCAAERYKDNPLRARYAQLAVCDCLLGVE